MHYLQSYIMIDMFKKKSRCKENSLEMEMLLRRAHELLANNNIEGLKDLIRTIWRRLQSRLMLEPYLLADHDACGDIAFNFCSFSELQGCYQGQANSYISLIEPVLTFPWHPNRIINNLGVIGENRINGRFTSSSNHSANYYWPLMLIKVTGGNHSIAQGILMGEGEIALEDWYNLTPLLKKYRCNGPLWINNDTNKIVMHCDCPELGMAWEVSRLLASVCPPPLQASK